MIKRRRHRRRSEEAGRRVPGAAPRGDVREEGDRRGERDHPRQGAAGHEEEEAGEPAERVHHQRRLLSRLRARAEEPATEQMQLWTDVFRARPRRTASTRRSPDYIKPGCSCSAAGASSASSSGDRRAHVDELRERHQGDAEDACRRSSPTCTACATSRSRRTIQLAIRGNPIKLGDEVPRRFLSVLSDGEPTPFDEGSGRLELADDDLRAAARRPRHRQSHLEGPLRHRHRRHAEQLRRATASGRPIPSCSSIWRSSFVENGMSIKKLHREIMLSAVYQLERRRTSPQRRQGFRQPPLLAREPPAARRPSSFATRSCSSPARSKKRWAGRRGADAGLQSPDDLRQGQPLPASTRSSSSSTSRRRRSPPSSASRPTCRCSGCS